MWALPLHCYGLELISTAELWDLYISCRTNEYLEVLLAHEILCLLFE